MARPAGITREDVARAAIAYVDERGFDALTLSGVAASLGVQPPSLYHHVEGVAGLRRLVIEEGIATLSRIAREARQGRTGAEAFVAHAESHRRLAHERPGLYSAVNAAGTIAEEPELWASLLESIQPMADTLRELGVPEDNVLEGLRLLRASMHGFISLELVGDFGFDLDLDRSYRHLIDVILTGLRDTLT